MSAAEAYAHVTQGMQTLRGHWRAQRIIEGTLYACSVALIGLVAVVLLDNLLHPDAVGRLLLALLFWATLAVGAVRWIMHRVMEDHRDDFFAALMEQKHPHLGNRVINALQLGRGNAIGAPALIDAIVRDGAHAVADVDAKSCLDQRPLQRAGIMALAIFALLFIYGMVQGARFNNGLARVLLPWASIPPFTATRVDDSSVTPGDARVAEGEAVTFLCRVKGPIPPQAQLWRRGGDNTWRAVVMLPADSPDSFVYSTPQVSESCDYFIQANDGRSKIFRVTVVQRPRLEQWEVTLAPPAYTGLKPETFTTTHGEIHALLGTRVTITLSANKTLDEAKLVTEVGEEITLQPTSVDGQESWSGSFLLWRKDLRQRADLGGRVLFAPTRYQIRLRDKDGYENRDPLWRVIALSRDQNPTVSIPNPGRDLQLKPAETLPLEITARDDYGIAQTVLRYRVNDEAEIHELARFTPPEEISPRVRNTFTWKLGETRRPRGTNSVALKSGDRVRYWAEASDRNLLTGPGKAESRHFTVFLVTPEVASARLEMQLLDFAEELRELIKAQSLNRAETAASTPLPALIQRQQNIRDRTGKLARAMERDAVPVATMISALDELFAGPMAQIVQLLEDARASTEAAKVIERRQTSLPIQDDVVAKLKTLLDRLQKNEQARKELKRLAKTDKATHKQVTEQLGNLIKDLDRLLDDEKELVTKFEKLPKRNVEEFNQETLQALKEFDAFHEKWHKWGKGKVDELTKLPQGFKDDFNLRKDVNSIFEEIEKAATRPKASKLEVALEDLGAGLATEMLEDLETWMPDAADSVKWVQEEPLTNKPMQIPEMPLPNSLEDLVGELLQEAEEFDEEADDVTSAWGDNLNQAGWGVMDGPIASFSAKGKTGNDLPNQSEMTGRSGDGRRGKSSGQMVGDTARGLQGRKTPARVGNEQYEPGQIQMEDHQDPNGATGGGKKAGAGRRGLQGGTPPDFVRDMTRLGEKQAGVREKAEQVASRLDSAGVNSRRLRESIDLMKSAEEDLRDLRYEDAARKRRVALGSLKNTFAKPDENTSLNLNRAREIPAAMREELLQATDETYPEGYETLLKSYFRQLSEAGK